MKGKFITHSPEDWKIITDYVKASAMANFDNAENLILLKQAVLRAKVMELDVEDETTEKQ